jgi:hypothetical protein
VSICASTGATAAERAGRTRGAMIAFSTEAEPQTEQVTIPAAFSLSKAAPD